MAIFSTVSRFSIVSKFKIFASFDILHILDIFDSFDILDILDILESLEMFDIPDIFDLRFHKVTLGRNKHVLYMLAYWPEGYLLKRVITVVRWFNSCETHLITWQGKWHAECRFTTRVDINVTLEYLKL